jgi:hypothetical protein
MFATYFHLSRLNQRRGSFIYSKEWTPATFLWAVEGIITVSKLPHEVDVEDYVMAAVCSIETEVYRTRQKGKKQQLLVDTGGSKLDYIFNTLRWTRWYV